MHSWPQLLYVLINHVHICHSVSDAFFSNMWKYSQFWFISDSGASAFLDWIIVSIPYFPSAGPVVS